jgi:hypothetical protein
MEAPHPYGLVQKFVVRPPGRAGSERLFEPLPVGQFIPRASLPRNESCARRTVDAAPEAKDTERKPSRRCPATKAARTVRDVSARTADTATTTAAAEAVA